MYYWTQRSEYLHAKDCSLEIGHGHTKLLMLHGHFRCLFQTSH